MAARMPVAAAAASVVVAVVVVVVVEEDEEEEENVMILFLLGAAIDSNYGMVSSSMIYSLPFFLRSSSWRLERSERQTLAEQARDRLQN